MTFPVLLLASLLGVFDGANHIGVTWDDANGDARFALVEARPQAIASSIILGHGEPRIAFDGSIYFVAWLDANGLEVQRLSRDGDLLGAPIRVAQKATSPAITAIENGIALVWEEPGYAIRGGVVLRDGTVALGLPLAGNTFELRPWRIAYDGRRYLILYRQFFSAIVHSPLLTSEMRMLVVDRDGNPVSGPAKLPIDDWHDVAAGPHGFVVSGTGPWDIRYVFVDDGGNMPRGVEYLWLYPRAPVYVRWNGANFVVFFTPFAKRLDADGHVIDDDRRPPLVDPNINPRSIVTTPDKLFTLSFDGAAPVLTLAEPARIRAARP
jgi:hypothetical protein